MLKKVAIAFAVLIVLLALGGVYLWSNLDHMIKVAVEKYGTAATQATVSLDSVKLSLSSGEGSLGGLSVGNPKGFSSAKAFYLGSVAVQVDTGSATGNGPIVIRKVVIDQPQVTYELLNSGSSNLQTIQHNAQAYASATAAGGNGSADAAAASGPQKPGRKFIINDLTITNGKVAISQEMLKGKQLSGNLPTIHLTNIGKSSGGATAAQVAQQLIGSISTSAAQVAVTELAKEKISGTLGAVPGSAIGGAALDTVGSQVKGIFGQ